MNDDQPKDAEFKKISEEVEQTSVENSKQKSRRNLCLILVSPNSCFTFRCGLDSIGITALAL